MVLGKLQRLFLQCLYKLGGRSSSFFLYKNLKLPLSDFFQICNSLESRQMIKLEGGFWLLTEAGNLYVLNTMREKRGVLQMPKCFQNFNRIDVDEFYIPNARLWRKQKTEELAKIKQPTVTRV